jgi:hypothetical protein
LTPEPELRWKSALTEVGALFCSPLEMTKDPDLEEIKEMLNDKRLRDQDKEVNLHKDSLSFYRL